MLLVAIWNPGQITLHAVCLQLHVEGCRSYSARHLRGVPKHFSLPAIFSLASSTLSLPLLRCRAKAISDIVTLAPKCAQSCRKGRLPPLVRGARMSSPRSCSTSPALASLWDCESSARCGMGGRDVGSDPGDRDHSRTAASAHPVLLARQARDVQASRCA